MTPSKLKVGKVGETEYVIQFKGIGGKWFDYYWGTNQPGTPEERLAICRSQEHSQKFKTQFRAVQIVKTPMEEGE